MTLLHPTTRADWRSWLAAHHDRETEIWLVYNKRHTGEPRVEYDDAVEEALCFGWIDSVVRTIDENRYAQKLTPRKAKSKWFPSNRERFARMVREGKMAPAGMAKAPPPEEDPVAEMAPAKRVGDARSGLHRGGVAGQRRGLDEFLQSCPFVPAAVCGLDRGRQEGGDAAEAVGGGGVLVGAGQEAGVEVEGGGSGVLPR